MDKSLFSSPTPFTPPTTEDDRLSWLRLIRSRRVGPATFHRLLAEHGSASAALDALPGIARAAGVTGYEVCGEGLARAEFAAARRIGAEALFFGNPDYPADLMDLPDAPPVLWVLGNPDLLHRPAVALVGARNASSLGLRMARRLARELAEEGILVVSGLARGIDAAAHDAALESGTLAVMAGGVDVIYPTENTALAQDIARRGARVSEQPVGLVPQARHFPQRNRIISGIALGVIVVEAASQSGSLITARNALDQGREVMAVPGHPVDPRAAGGNRLIRDGAVLIRDAADVLEALGPALSAARSARASTGLAAGLTTARGEAVQTATGRIAHLAIAARTAIAARVAAAGRTDSLRSLAERRGSAPGTRGEATSRRPDRPAAGASAQNAAAEAASEADHSAERALHAEILSRLSPAPLAEDQLIRDLDLPAAQVASELLSLELEGLIQRAPGGFLSRAS